MLTLGNQSKLEYSPKLMPFETVKGTIEKIISIGETINAIVYVDLKENEPAKIWYIGI